MSSLKKKDLVKSPNLKKTFIAINQHLYGKLKYADTDTRARSKEIINLLLCKLVDEINKSPEDEMDICIKDTESEQKLIKRVQAFFQENVKKKYPNVIGEKEEITLNEDLLFYYLV